MRSPKPQIFVEMFVSQKFAELSMERHVDPDQICFFHAPLSHLDIILDPRALVFYHVTDRVCHAQREGLWGRE